MTQKNKNVLFLINYGIFVRVSAMKCQFLWNLNRLLQLKIYFKGKKKKNKTIILHVIHNWYFQLTIYSFFSMAALIDVHRIIFNIFVFTEFYISFVVIFFFLCECFSILKLVYLLIIRIDHVVQVNCACDFRHTTKIA